MVKQKWKRSSGEAFHHWVLIQVSKPRCRNFNIEIFNIVSLKLHLRFKNIFCKIFVGVINTSLYVHLKLFNMLRSQKHIITKSFSTAMDYSSRGMHVKN